ncbi:hypothetical protein PR048_018237 [Dryococelus australis]|uniref:HTH psq-type domain-containing protein n=1 Tax=Dryococelus australis TaxID=614101 RepID=A0ABQ9HC36_9NEOP|nr:hypothetical protein PR048_018237 [Dryococelus australis]
MPRYSIRKNSHGSWSTAVMEEAARAVKDGEYSVRKAATVFGVPFSSLQRRTSSPEDSPVSSVGRKSVQSPDFEKVLAVRLIYLSSGRFGLTPNSIRK